MERTLESVKKRMQKLEQIEKHHEDALDCDKRDQMYAFFLQRAQLDITKETIEKLKAQIHLEEFRLEEIQKKLEELKTEQKSKQEMETNLRVELRQNKDFLALEEQEKEKERLKAEEKNCLKEKKLLMDSVKAARGQLRKLLEMQKADDKSKALFSFEKEEGLAEYYETLQDLDKADDIAVLQELTARVIRSKKSIYERVHHKIAEIQVEINTCRTEREEVSQKIHRLEKKKLTYPAGVEALVLAIKEEFARIGRKAEPYVLCELLEISDEGWRNAAEGYLNTQRFYVLVEPNSFDIALGIYDRLRRERKVFGVGLINTQGLETYEEAAEGTLASVIRSKNPYARRYINMILGKVKLCDRYEELKKYPISITRECMRYQNRVASAIKPEIYKVPFIGSHALKVQLEQAKKKKEEIGEKLNGLEASLKTMDSITASLNTEADVDIKYRLEVISRLRMLQQAVKKCEDNIKTLKKNATIIEKQIQLQALEKILADLQRESDGYNQEIGTALQKKEDEKRQLENLTGEVKELQEEVNEILVAAGDVQGVWLKEYEAQTKQKSFAQFRENYARQRKSNETRRQTAIDRMVDIMIRYKTEHDFGAAPSMEGYPEFATVYERLRTSELLDYEEKVEQARISAEEEFREQFLAKLQENMKQAQGEFKELNKALKDIRFSNEQYEFIYMPSGRYRNYYNMIMDDFNVVQGVSIFSGIFHETHKEVIDELFERLTLNNESSAQTLAEFTDYRTYMDYDIKIVHSDGSFSYYSKVCEEKSGGETQTPFYVTVAASFVQLYTNNIGGEAAGLVMFDEAFNNMDDERIGGVLEFMNRLPLQLVIAAPPDKIQYIGPSMEETLLVMTDEKTSFVEKYCHEV